ncbi:adenosylcobinamide-phosphate synthase CbiB [Segatella salivae]|uniref:adenosylcobinamide-phosphate synthase CbiB n=1 Tax=Segatella salivae TaxID=228604 RepID=UPI0028DC29CB|nr:adenosylcobinamide-phosphate synthase CbiB [Segatella salivae]
MFKAVSLIIGWIADRILGDPEWLPHPIVFFGRVIAFGERKLNKGQRRCLKGAALTIVLTACTFMLFTLILSLFDDVICVVLEAVCIFYCLAGTTLVREVKSVFAAVNVSVEQGRAQVSRIVGRDTSELSAQEIRLAALETLAENLSDGVVAPLFWLVVLGVPGMMTYKMINTLDSMIGYRTRRFRRFGMLAARLDDVVNWVPARLTALLMLLVSVVITPMSRSRFMSIWHDILMFSKAHLSPNSGWPEAALASILACRFGGPHIYYGEMISKPYIGRYNREITSKDLIVAIKLNRYVELVVIVLLLLFSV